MRAIGLCLLATVAIVYVGAPRMAAAEKIRINQPAKVYVKAGERSSVIMTLKTGDKVNKIGQDGRWLHVRANGRTGWLPRSKADVPEADLPRNTRRRAFVDGRGTDRGSLGDSAPDDRVGGDAVGDGGAKDADADADADSGDDTPATAKKPKKPPAAKPPKVASKDKPGDKDKDADADDGDGDTVVVKDDDDDGGGDSKDDKPAPEEPKRPTAHVGAKTTIFSDKDKDSDAAFTAKPDDVLFVNGATSGKWTEVENSEGDLGYVQSSKLELSDDGGDGDDGAPHTREIALRARGGITFVSEAMKTAGSTATSVPDNYSLASAAVTLSLGGMYLRPYNKNILFGGDLNFAAAKAVPGVQYTPMGGTATTIGFSIYTTDIRGLVAYDLHKKTGMLLVGRLGFRYDSFQVSNAGDLTKNVATIPSEIQISPALGAGLLVPRVTPTIGLAFALDGMVSASVKQTKGIEDGKSPSAKGICANASFIYHYSKQFDIQAAYDLKYMSDDYGAVDPASLRMHAGTSVSRSDTSHMLTVGISKDL